MRTGKSAMVTAIQGQVLRLLACQRFARGMSKRNAARIKSGLNCKAQACRMNKTECLNMDVPSKLEVPPAWRNGDVPFDQAEQSCHERRIPSEANLLNGIQYVSSSARALRNKVTLSGDSHGRATSRRTTSQWVNGDTCLRKYVPAECHAESRTTVRDTSMEVLGPVYHTAMQAPSED
ncbi:hypothetical protein FKP32DRAFT_1156174 [Trametes sanguinea]|nr:hypothetical protein FKP32DRAFT_1156174 [Trametes sanguinea]